MLNEKSLKSSLSNGSILPVYLITGDDLYLKKQALDRIIKATVEPDDEMNLIRFEYGASLQQVYDELNGFPLMADKKCVVYSELDLDDCSKTEFENLCELASEHYDTSVFVIYFGNMEFEYKKSAKAKQLIAAVEKAGGAMVLLEHKTSSELVRWMTAWAKKRNCNLSPRDAAYIIETCSSDISTLSYELEKLCAFVSRGDITREIIDKICVKSVDASVFELSNKVISGDTSGAMKLVDELYYMNVDTAIIFHHISSAYVDMYRAFIAKSEGRIPNEELAEQLHMPANRRFLLGKAAGNLRKFDRKKLELSLDAIISSEREIKNYSSSSRTAVEKLIVRLVYIMKTGESLD